MTSHDNRDNILSDQKLHDLLKAEGEMERVAESKRNILTHTKMPCDEETEELLL